MLFEEVLSEFRVQLVPVLPVAQPEPNTDGSNPCTTIGLSDGGGEGGGAKQ